MTEELMDITKIMTGHDSAVTADPEIASILNQKRRNSPLGFEAVKKLMEALQPGMARQANLEQYKEGWRLRFSLYDDTGTAQRKSIVIEDISIMEWVREFLTKSRQKRSDYMRDLRLQELFKSLEGSRACTQEFTVIDA